MSYNRETGKYEGFIYKISSTETDNEYIGQTTKKDIYARYKDHLSASKNQDQALYRGIRLHGADTFHVELIKKFEAYTNKDIHNILNDMEKYYIAKYDTYHNGYNETPGGQGVTGGDRVVVYDKDGNYLFESDSATEMAEIIGCDVGVVIKCCKGKTVPRDNYIFRYYGDDFNKYPTYTIHKGSKTIYCFDLDGVFIEKYRSIKDASIKMNIPYVQLQPAVKFKRTVCGYYFNTEKVFDYNGNHRYKVAVDIYDCETKNFVGSFDSIKDALLFIGKEPDKCSHIGINGCINGIYDQALGYIWTLKGAGLPDSLHVNASSVMKPINMYTKDGVFIKTFPSQSVAKKELDMKSNSISGCLRGRQKSSHGYCFYYANDPNQPDPTKVTDITAQELFNKQAA